QYIRAYEESEAILEQQPVEPYTEEEVQLLKAELKKDNKGKKKVDESTEPQKKDGQANKGKAKMTEDNEPSFIDVPSPKKMEIIVEETTVEMDTAGMEKPEAGTKEKEIDPIQQKKNDYEDLVAIGYTEEEALEAVYGITLQKRDDRRGTEENTKSTKESDEKLDEQNVLEEPKPVEVVAEKALELTDEDEKDMHMVHELLSKIKERSRAKEVAIETAKQKEAELQKKLENAMTESESHKASLYDAENERDGLILQLAEASREVTSSQEARERMEDDLEVAKDELIELRERV
ncbi:hypothetical protein, partial [Enterobacter cloacae complex sp. GF14B]|uniref:hypothetical protein n=1 Tax=Enterobacter cloacae complex sp. GF14B TaxID=2511982 RepID=UPI0010267DC7